MVGSLWNLTRVLFDLRFQKKHVSPESPASTNEKLAPAVASSRGLTLRYFQVFVQKVLRRCFGDDCCPRDPGSITERQMMSFSGCPSSPKRNARYLGSITILSFGDWISRVGWLVGWFGNRVSGWCDPLDVQSYMVDGSEIRRSPPGIL